MASAPVPRTTCEPKRSTKTASCFRTVPCAFGLRRVAEHQRRKVLQQGNREGADGGKVLRPENPEVAQMSPIGTKRVTNTE